MSMAEHVDLMPFESRHGRTLQRVGGSVREQRDPTAATEPLRWTSPDMPMIAEWDADQAVRFGYYANVIAFRCVQLTAQTIGNLFFRAGLNPDHPGSYDPAAPLARLLGPAPGGPAPKLPAAKLWAWSIAQRMVTGRFAWELELSERTKGDIVAIWPLVSANLQALPTESGAEWFRGFRYGRPDKPRDLNPDQVFYAWDPSATNFRQPESALDAARYDLSIAVMGDRYSHSFLKNGATPAAVVVTRAFADPKLRQRFRNQWRAQYQGPDNAGRVAFHEAEADDEGGKIGDAIDVRVLGLSQKDSQFIEQHKASLERIAIGLGVPWSKLDASGRTFDNASQEDLDWWETSLLPKIRTYQDEINMDLAPRLGREVGWFDLSKVRALAHNKIQRGDVPALMDRGALLIDEARDFYGLEPLPNGMGQTMATPPQAISITTPGGARGTEPVPQPAPVLPPRGGPAPDPHSPRRGQVAHPPTRVRVPHTRALTADQIEQRRARLWKRTDAAAKVIEARWQRSFRRLFARQLDATLKRLEGKRGRQATRAGEAASVFDPTFWTAQTADMAADLYETVTASAVSRMADQFAIDFDLENPRLRAFIDARANQLAGQVTDTTYQQIQDALAEGSAAGEGIDGLADRVRHVFAVADEARAVTIARTEVVSAYNGATSEFAALAGPDVVAGQEWIATRDGRTREDHAGADGQVVAVGDSFDVGGEMLEYPGDPGGDPANTVNCRCTVALLGPDEMDAQANDDSGRSVPLAAAHAVIGLASGPQFDAVATRVALRKVSA